MSTKKFIDIKKILREKAPTTYKLMPGFFIKWLQRKLHEEEINRGMEYLGQFEGLKHNEEILKYLKIDVVVTNAHHIPKNESVIFASNHPLGGLDGMALIKAVGEVRPDVRFIVNDILRNLKNFGDIFVGVNKVGNSSRHALSTIEEVYASNAAILIFPAGLVSRKGDEGIKDLEWNKSFISKAIKYNKPIIPVHIEGKNSKFFYNLARWRKRLGIKANLEMLFLPDEMFKQQGKIIKIHFGEKIEPSVFDKKHTEKVWAEKLRNYIYSSDFKKDISFKG
jgi:putative hemolysin